MISVTCDVAVVALMRGLVERQGHSTTWSTDVPSHQVQYSGAFGRAFL